MAGTYTYNPGKVKEYGGDRMRFELGDGQRSGRVYKKPGTHGKPSKATRKLAGDYGHRLREGQLYRASAPGEAPARRMGNLRLHWNGEVKTDHVSKSSVRVSAVLESQENYSLILEEGRKGVAPRPFKDRIIEKAEPEIRKIYAEPYR